MRVLHQVHKGVHVVLSCFLIVDSRAVNQSVRQFTSTGLKQQHDICTVWHGQVQHFNHKVAISTDSSNTENLNAVSPYMRDWLYFYKKAYTVCAYLSAAITVYFMLIIINGSFALEAQDGRIAHIYNIPCNESGSRFLKWCLISQEGWLSVSFFGVLEIMLSDNKTYFG